MSEDLIERLTSKLFEDEVFSDFVVHQLCGFLTRESDEVYLKMRTEFKECIPKDVGINNYFTLDSTCKLEQVFLQLNPAMNTGDSGSTDGKQVENLDYKIDNDDSNEVERDPSAQSNNGDTKRLYSIDELPNESNRSGSF